MGQGSPRLRVRLEPQVPAERVDVALLRALVEQADVPLTRSALARAFERGVIQTAEGVRLRPGRTVDRPLVVELEVPVREPLRAVPEDLPLTILFEDEELLVVDKAAGMVVHAGAGHERGTLVNAILGHLGTAELPVLPGAPEHRPGIVHRLDKDTSGVLVVAKTLRAQEHLAAQFRTHSIERSYLGLVVGVPDWERRRIESGHGRDPRHRRRFSPTAVGPRRAVTDAELVQRLAGAALVRFRLHTGRTHQIRMHARMVGHPIVADALYGSAARDALLPGAARALGRHALHAETLGLSHPSGEFLRWRSPLPDDLARLLAELGGHRVDGD